MQAGRFGTTLRTVLTAALFVVAAMGAPRGASAQNDDRLTDEELEELVGPIALYPDDLVAIILPASTYPLDIVEAARFLDEREADPGLMPDEEWDDSVVALLNYPEVLRLMDEDLDWTWDLGEAFLTQRASVLDAIQRFRAAAREAGNLESDDRLVVDESDDAIRIRSADPEVIYVPYYEPRHIVVHHHVPIHYYPRPYPVYYYPYPPHHHFHLGFFFGVTTAFVIGWDTHHVHVHHHLHPHHPFHGHHYHAPLFVRHSINVNFVRHDRDVYIWQPRHRHGARPERVIRHVREGAVHDRHGTRRHVTRTAEGRAVTRGVEGRAITRDAERRTISRDTTQRQAVPLARDGGARGTERGTFRATERVRSTAERRGADMRSPARVGERGAAATVSRHSARLDRPNPERRSVTKHAARTQSATPPTRTAAPARMAPPTRMPTQTRTSPPSRSTMHTRSGTQSRTAAPSRSMSSAPRARQAGAATSSRRVSR
ncbi:MAG: DUF3300 domain-containing protein [Gammaproteobacteria bacterium]